MTLLVKHVMSSPVVSLHADHALPTIEDIMTFRHVRHLPVIDPRHHVVGIVTHRDLLKAQISSLTGLTPDERRARQADVLAKHVMTKNVWTVPPGMTAAMASRMLLDHRFGCLPVVDELDRLVGIVTERDFVRVAAEYLEGQAVPA